MRPAVLALCLLPLLPFGDAKAQSSRARARHEKEWNVKARKLERHLLRTMRKHGVDMWILMSRENHPDPILDLFGAYGVSGWYGHRNAYIFYDAGAGGLETTVIGTHLSDHLKRFYANILPYGEEARPSPRGPSCARDPRDRGEPF
jgi:hypothetical protein